MSNPQNDDDHDVVDILVADHREVEASSSSWRPDRTPSNTAANSSTS